VIVAALLIGGRAGLRPAWRWLKPDRAIIRRLLRIGVPGGADSLVVVFCHLWFVAVVNRLGDLATAAHGVAIRVESMAYMPGFAFHVAAATLAGQYLGAGDMPRAKRSSWTTLAVGGGVMSAIGLLMFSLPETMVRIFVRADQTEVIASASSLVRIVSLTMPALAAASILGGALRGAGDTRWPLLFTLGSMLCVRIPGAYLLSQHAVSVPLMDWTIEGAGLGIVGAWYAMAIDITIRAALTAGRFKQGAWQHVKV
jgi:putative MATE family efflux protein